MNIYEDFSEDYEVNGATGQIMVPTRNGEVQVSDYDVLNGIGLTQSATDYLPLPIDKDYGVNELIDGYEAEAVPDNLKAQRIESAGYSIGMKKESLAVEALKKKSAVLVNYGGIAVMTGMFIICAAYLVDQTYNPFLYFNF